MSFVKIGFQNSSCLDNILKTGLPPWFYKNHFQFKNYISNFSCFSIKSYNYQNITETHHKLSIWVLTSYKSPTMLSMRSKLCPSSNSTFPTLGTKSSKMSFFLLVSQNNDLRSKLNPTRQHEFRGIVSFQNRALDIKLLKFHINQENNTYLEKHDF